MAKFKTIIIHVGPPNTGSTFLQQQLHQAVELLAAVGWAVPSRFLAEEHGMPTKDHAWIFRLIVGQLDVPNSPIPKKAAPVPALFRDWLSRCTQPGLILSWEGCASWGEMEWTKFRDFLGEFMDEQTEIRFLYFYREPLRWFVSNRNQWAKQGRAMKLPDVEMEVAFGRESSAMFSVWGDSASYEPHCYESAMDKGLWPYFLDCIGLNLGQTQPPPHLSPSVSLEAIWILGACEPRNFEEVTWMRKVWAFPGSRDGLTVAEAEVVWQKHGLPMNRWLKRMGHAEYAYNPPLISLDSPDLWPDRFVDAWRDWAQGITPAERRFFAEACQRVNNAPYAQNWHPDARQRFDRLLETVGARPAAEPAPPGAKPRPGRRDKWQSAAKLCRAVLSDALSGRRRWPATERQLKSLQPQPAAPALAQVLAPRPQTPSNAARFDHFTEEGWLIPPREDWHRDPFNAERFPDLQLLSFHIPKTAGSSFAASVQASSFGAFSFLSHLSFVQLKKETEALPAEDRGLAAANAIANRLPKDTRGIQGHILLNSALAPFLLTRPEVLKVVWVRKPEWWAHSQYAFIRQTLLKHAPLAWQDPRMVDSIFRDLLQVVNRPEQQNFQSKQVDTIGFENFDFVGVTECFDEDLAQIDALLNHPGLQPIQTNASKKSRPMTPEEITAIRQYHAEDVALYERVLAQRARRKK